MQPIENEKFDDQDDLDDDEDGYDEEEYEYDDEDDYDDEEYDDEYYDEEFYENEVKLVLCPKLVYGRHWQNRTETNRSFGRNT